MALSTPVNYVNNARKKYLIWALVRSFNVRIDLKGDPFKRSCSVDAEAKETDVSVAPAACIRLPVLTHVRAMCPDFPAGNEGLGRWVSLSTPHQHGVVRLAANLLLVTPLGGSLVSALRRTSLNLTLGPHYPC